MMPVLIILLWLQELTDDDVKKRQLKCIKLLMEAGLISALHPSITASSPLTGTDKPLYAV